MPHTPGPWTVHRVLGQPVVHAIYGRPGMDDSQLKPVQMLGYGVNQEANARLIAAAPAMLLALKEAVALLGSLEKSAPMLHAVIRDATGEE
jgi:hypothetical protein